MIQTLACKQNGPSQTLEANSQLDQTHLSLHALWNRDDSEIDVVSECCILCCSFYRVKQGISRLITCIISATPDFRSGVKAWPDPHSPKPGKSMRHIRWDLQQLRDAWNTSISLSCRALRKNQDGIRSSVLCLRYLFYSYHIAFYSANVKEKLSLLMFQSHHNARMNIGMTLILCTHRMRPKALMYGTPQPSHIS